MQLKYYSNKHETCNFIEQILNPYINNVREQESLPVIQKSLVIMDVFTGKMATVILDLYEESNIVVCTPEKMIKPLELRVHGYAKRLTRRKFKNWYSSQISKQLDEDKPLHGINDPLQLSLLTPIHTERMVKLYNQMTPISSKDTSG